MKKVKECLIDFLEAILAIIVLICILITLLFILFICSGMVGLIIDFFLLVFGIPLFSFWNTILVGGGVMILIALVCIILDIRKENKDD